MKINTISPLSSGQKQKHGPLKNLNNSVLKLWHNISHYLAYILILCIQLFRPFLGPDNVCPFTIGCTEYAIAQLQKQPFCKALCSIAKRILSCNPLFNFFKKKSPAPS